MVSFQLQPIHTLRMKGSCLTCILLQSVAYPGIFFGGGGVQQIQLRTDERENGDLGAVAP